MKAFLLTILTLALCCQTAFAQKTNADWRAGVAKAVITPDQPVWMAGYGSRTKPSEGTSQELYAKALALQDNRGKRVVIVTTDILGIPREMGDAIASGVAQKYKLTRANLVLTSTHTHTGPVPHRNLEGAYFLDEQQAAAVKRNTARMTEKIIAVVGEALRELQPATLSFGRGAAHFGINRRVNRDGRFVFGSNKDGVKDDDVPLLQVRSADGRLRAVLLSYACHNTTLTDTFYQFNGDYAGYVQAEIEQAHPGAVAMFMMGAGADINPEPRGKLEMAQAHGKALAETVARILAGSLRPLRGNLNTAYANVALPLDVMTREQLQAQTQDKDKYRRAHAQRWLARLDRDGKVMTEYPYPLQVVQLGNDLTLVAMSGEVVVDYVLRLKQELGAERLWVAAYCNDVMAYIPSVRILKEGGYEADFSMIYYDLPGKWNPAVEEIIIRNIHALARKAGRK
ncbi:MAG: neutral/alkaline non-lysosomal ceramidase N-terminal domain-containing protein [Acidobacteria bacterium]|nr:neutral/alkaline non-lysosomal ceramidase N-terminal domain-containing protein [Acidobacteriota bacterium]